MKKKKFKKSYSEPLPDSTLKETVEEFFKCGESKSETARKLNVSRGAVRHRMETAIKRGLFKPHARSAGDEKERTIFRLEQDIRQLRRELHIAQKHSLDTDKVREKIFGLHSEPCRMPDWLVEVPKATKSPIGTPICMWTDWHFGEDIQPDQVQGVNKYNAQIAQTRVRRLVESTIDILRNHMVSPEYPGVIIQLGGDMVAGEIHEELMASNDLTSVQAVLECRRMLRWAITAMAKEFGNIVVPCVFGNHGRLTKKMTFKDAAYRNLDWLIYQLLEDDFKKDKRVTIVAPPDIEVQYRLYEYTIVLTHGAQYSGGQGFIGPVAPIVRGEKRKSHQAMSMGKPFDLMFMGHHHTHVNGDRVFASASLPGYSEYAHGKVLEYSRPSQGLYMVHPVNGVTFPMRVYVDSDARKNTCKDSDSWVQINPRGKTK